MINLENHKSASLIWNFSNNIIPTPQNLMWDYVRIIDEILTSPRAGWLLRWIPEKLAETTNAHCAKVAIATHLIITGKCYIIPQNDIRDVILTWGLHDLCEWNWINYTPHDLANGVITKEWKYQAELRNLQRFTMEYNDPVPEKLWLNLENQPDNKEYKLIHQLDKLDAGVMALNYEAHGYNVEEFFPYTKEKLSDPFLKYVFEWLLRKEFPTLDYFYQYCIFLACEWILTEVRQVLKDK